MLRPKLLGTITALASSQHCSPAVLGPCSAGFEHAVATFGNRSLVIRHYSGNCIPLYGDHLAL